MNSHSVEQKEYIIGSLSKSAQQKQHKHQKGNTPCRWVCFSLGESQIKNMQKKHFIADDQTSTLLQTWRCQLNPCSLCLLFKDNDGKRPTLDSLIRLKRFELKLPTTPPRNKPDTATFYDASIRNMHWMNLINLIVTFKYKFNKIKNKQTNALKIN